MLRSEENVEERYFQKELVEQVRRIIQTHHDQCTDSQQRKRDQIQNHWQIP